MSVPPDLTGRVALVTGGPRGVGRAIVLALAQAGADVAVNFAECAEAGEAVAALVRQLGRRAIAVGADVSDAAQVAAMMARAGEKPGPVGILVNNARLALTPGLDDPMETDFDRTIAVNLKSAFLCVNRRGEMTLVT